MHYADIKAHIEKAGSSQSAIAREVRGRSGGSVTPAAVHLVVRGVAASRAIAKHISHLIGVPVSQLWPGKYPDLEAGEMKQRRRAAR